MPIYEFDLSDGTTVTVESDTEPTDEQVLGALQTQEVPVEEPRFTQNLGQVLSAPQPELPSQTIPYTSIPESMAPMVDWERFQAGPTFAEERTTGVPSAAGLTPEIVPPGTEIAKSPAFPAIRPFLGLAGMVAPETAATIASSAAKTGIGISEYLTSPQGVTELVGSMSPARLLVFGKWFVDMAKGTFEEAGTLSALLAKPNKTQEDWQAISDHTVSGIAMFLGAAGAGYKTGKIAAGYLPKGGKIKVEDRSELINRMEEELRASRQAQEGSPFVRAQAPPELSLPPGVQGPPAAFPISMGMRTQPPLSPATELGFQPTETPIPMPRTRQSTAVSIPETWRPTFDPSGLGVAGRGVLPIPPDVGRLQPPSPTIAPPTPSGRAAQAVRVSGEAAQRIADWEKAMAEKVAKEQEQPAHPDKPLTENQLRIIRESLEKQILEGQIPGERKGFIVGSALEAWADGVIKQGPKMTNMGVDPRLAAAAIVKGAALLERGITNAAEWTAAMIREHGESIRPFLGQIRRDSEQVRAKTFTQKPTEEVPKETAPTEAPKVETEPTAQRTESVPVNEPPKVARTAESEFPEATRPVVDPITGEPAKVITEAAARSMESKVKLSSQVDVDKLKAQLELFDKEIGDALESGGQFLPKEMRTEVAKGAPAERKTVTNKEINQYFVNKLSSIRKQMKATKQRIAQQADVESQVYFDTLQKRFETAFRQVQELRRASHEALYFWNKIRAEYQDIARAAGAMPEMKRQLPILDQVWKDVREGDYRQGGRHFIDFLRMNLFTLGSWTLDFGTNLVATTTKIPAWAIMDAASFVSGNPATRMMSATRALADNMKNWIPFGRRFRLPDQIESELGTTAGGEFGGKGREVIVDFSEILRTKPELADKLRHLDKLLGAPVRMKRAVDSFFGRFGATAELYNRAYQEGRTRGLKGDELKQFAEEYIQKPPDATIARAVKTGKELKFNRDLSRFEESFSSNLGIKVFVEAFPRWTMQFMRWGGEMVGVDPVFFKDLVTGKATAEQTVTYLTKAATGWGGIYAFNQLFYDNIDANSMEYVKEDGDRVRLAGRTPAPELFFISALLRGDTQKAKAALAHLSLPGAKLLSGEPAGLISPLVDTIRESIRGRYTAEQTTRELSNLVNNAIPGKSVLGLIRSLYDPTIRQGIGAPIPGVASLLPQRINPTTGEPLAPKQKIPGTKFEIPTVGGTPFPGATRVLNDIESALLNHGLGLTRPRRTSIIDLPAEDVPKKVRQEYEIAVGKYVKEFVGGVITEPEFKSMEFEDRREVLKQLLEAARLNAKADLSDKYGTSMAPVPSLPLNIERMPERLRK